jgi:hypothetical protein
MTSIAGNVRELVCVNGARWWRGWRADASSSIFLASCAPAPTATRRYADESRGNRKTADRTELLPRRQSDAGRQRARFHAPRSTTRSNLPSRKLMQLASGRNGCDDLPRLRSEERASGIPATTAERSSACLQFPRGRSAPPAPGTQPAPRPHERAGRDRERTRSTGTSVRSEQTSQLVLATARVETQGDWLGRPRWSTATSAGCTRFVRELHLTPPRDGSRMPRGPMAVSPPPRDRRARCSAPGPRQEDTVWLPDGRQGRVEEGVADAAFAESVRVGPDCGRARNSPALRIAAA